MQKKKKAEASDLHSPSWLLSVFGEEDLVSTNRDRECCISQKPGMTSRADYLSSFGSKGKDRLNAVHIFTEARAHLKTIISLIRFEIAPN